MVIRCYVSVLLKVLKNITQKKCSSVLFKKNNKVEMVQAHFMIIDVIIFKQYFVIYFQESIFFLDYLVIQRKQRYKQIILQVHTNDSRSRCSNRLEWG